MDFNMWTPNIEYTLCSEKNTHIWRLLEKYFYRLDTTHNAQGSPTDNTKALKAQMT